MFKIGFARVWYVSLVALLLVAVIVCGESASAQVVGPINVELGRKLAVPLGAEIEVPVTFSNISTDLGVGGFSLLISYDTTGLTLLDVAPGSLIAECGWEHFDYDYNGSGLLRLVASPT